MNGPVIVVVAGVVGLCVVWDRAMKMILARQERREEDRLRGQRGGEPPVLGGAPRHLGSGGRRR